MSTKPKIVPYVMELFHTNKVATLSVWVDEFDVSNLSGDLKELRQYFDVDYLHEKGDGAIIALYPLSE